MLPLSSLPPFLFGLGPRLTDWCSPEVCPLSDSRACRGNNQDQTLRGTSRIIDFTVRYTLALGAYQVALNEGWTWVSEIMIGSWLVTNVPSMTY